MPGPQVTHSWPKSGPRSHSNPSVTSALHTPLCLPHTSHRVVILCNSPKLQTALFSCAVHSQRCWIHPTREPGGWRGGGRLPLHRWGNEGPLKITWLEERVPGLQPVFSLVGQCGLPCTTCLPGKEVLEDFLTDKDHRNLVATKMKKDVVNFFTLSPKGA